MQNPANNVGATTQTSEAYEFDTEPTIQSTGSYSSLSLTLILCFYFYTHILHFWIKKLPHV